MHPFITDSLETRPFTAPQVELQCLPENMSAKSSLDVISNSFIFYPFSQYFAQEYSILLSIIAESETFKHA